MAQLTSVGGTEVVQETGTLTITDNVDSANQSVSLTNSYDPDSVGGAAGFTRTISGQIPDVASCAIESFDGNPVTSFTLGYFMPGSQNHELDLHYNVVGAPR